MPGEAEMHERLDQISRTPETYAIAAEQHQLLHEAMLRLPPASRVLLVPHDMEDFETELVTRILGLQPGNIRVRLHRARQAVRNEMSHMLNREGRQKPPGNQALKRAAALRRGPKLCQKMSIAARSERPCQFEICHLHVSNTRRTMSYIGVECIYILRTGGRPKTRVVDM